MTLHSNDRFAPPDAPGPVTQGPQERCQLSNDAVAALVEKAMNRLCSERRSADISDAARGVLGSPVAAALACALCDIDDESAELIVADMIAAGVSVEEVCIDHLAAAARHLGDLWESDRLPFMDVTLATARIQQIMRKMPAPRKTTSAPATAASGAAVFCAVPGEQHTLGVIMAADLFRRNGWDVGLILGQEHDEVVARLARDDRPVIGLSCSGAHSRPALVRVIHAVREVRPTAHLVLSGRILSDPHLMEGLPPVDACIGSIEQAKAEIARFASLETA
ncbi:hypothetical protein roselon_01617 [Roseibacterium elongatum DSM 19469]|uniref:B12-binding domain-containing protein n=1 Tax=Roseicyclus elongatus DSM 19469 TaxID=1294273 RepID=W8S5B5_9RHOB|nr:cobalamin B12-binding domain-containing protein [Roseibacterium elongatum]AHM03996.1 hypothetical protein roselon_01617 [Roseibacterium elongatum DSM 19469]